MKSLVILSFAFFAAACVASNIDDASQTILDNINSKVLKLLSQKGLATGDQERISRRRRQLENTEQSSLDAVTDGPPIAPQAPPPIANAGGGDSPAESDSFLPDHVKKTLGNVQKTVQELGSKIVSTVGDFFSNVGRVVSDIINNNNDKPPE